MLSKMNRGLSTKHACEGGVEIIRHKLSLRPPLGDVLNAAPYKVRGAGVGLTVPHAPVGVL